MSEKKYEIPKRLTLAWASDWEALYADGHLVAQGHSIRVEDVVKLFDVQLDSVEASEPWLHEVGTFPLELKGVVERGE